MKKLIAVIISLMMCFCFSACSENSKKAEEIYPDASVIKMEKDHASIDGVEIPEYDYTWNVDPSIVHNDVKNAPAEYYTGTKPDTDAAAYIDHEIYYFPALDAGSFKLVNYDGEQEYAYYYSDGENNDYIFATLPKLGNTIPSSMMHTADEAAANKVLHITKAGTYILEGSWNGQIWIDLGDQDETFADEKAKVTLILNGVDINCSVAPGIVFYSVYEADNTWEDRKEYKAEVNIENAGANVIIADGTKNTVTGTNVFRMLKTKYKDENDTSAVKTQKKQRKTDGAFYSYVSMNISGGSKNTGTLEINGGFEGLDSELHLAINSGNITINSGDDGINVNEDNVSSVMFNGGDLTINAAQSAEGDGVDSNGFIAINGGTIKVNNVVAPDSAFDSENGCYYNGGTIVIDGKEQTLTKGSVSNSIGAENQGMGPNGGFDPNKHGRPDGQGGFDPGQQGQFGPGGNTGEFAPGQQGFGPEEKPGESNPDQGGFVPGEMQNFEDFDIKEFKQKISELDDDAGINDVLEILGINIQGFGGQIPQMPSGNDTLNHQELQETPPEPPKN